MTFAYNYNDWGEICEGKLCEFGHIVNIEPCKIFPLYSIAYCSIAMVLQHMHYRLFLFADNKMAAVRKPLEFSPGKTFNTGLNE